MGSERNREDKMRNRGEKSTDGWWRERNEKNGERRENGRWEWKGIRRRNGDADEKKRICTVRGIIVQGNKGTITAMKLWELTTLSYITQAWQWSPQLNDEISLFIKILLRQSCLNSQRIKLTTLGLRIEERKASASTGWVIRTMLISTMQQQCFFFACLSFISLLHIFVTINCCIHCNLTRRHTLPRHIHSKQKLRNCQTTNTLVMAMTTR